MTVVTEDDGCNSLEMSHAKVYSAKKLCKQLNSKKANIHQLLVDFLVLCDEWRMSNVDSGVNTHPVAQFCKVSNNGNELLQWFGQSDKLTISELHAIVKCCFTIIQTISSDLVVYRNFGGRMAHEIVAEHPRAMYKMLLPTTSTDCALDVLKLLTLCLQFCGESIADALVNHFDLTNPVFASLLHRRTIQADEDVRSCFVDFVIAWLANSSTPCLLRLLNIKGFVTQIIPGLFFDRYSTVINALSVFRVKIAGHEGLSRSLKVKLFGMQSLRHLVHLFAWSDCLPGEVVDGNSNTVHLLVSQRLKAGEVSLSGPPANVRRELEDILTQLCTSTSGIRFDDPTCGCGVLNRNPLLLAVAQMICASGFLALEECRRLLLAVFRAAPDCLGWWLVDAPESAWQPTRSDSFVWFTDLLHGVLSSDVFVPGDNAGAVKVVKVMQRQCLLPQIGPLVRRGVQSDDVHVIEKVTSLLHAVLTKLRTILRSVGTVSWATELRSSCMRSLPDAGVLEKTWHSSNQLLQRGASLSVVAKIWSNILLSLKLLFEWSYTGGRSFNFFALLNDISTAGTSYRELADVKFDLLVTAINTVDQATLARRQHADRPSIVGEVLLLAMCDARAVALFIDNIVAHSQFLNRYRSEMCIWLLHCQTVGQARFLEECIRQALCNPFPFWDQLQSARIDERMLHNAEEEYLDTQLCCRAASAAISPGSSVEWPRCSILPIIAAQVMKTTDDFDYIQGVFGELMRFLTPEAIGHLFAQMQSPLNEIHQSSSAAILQPGDAAKLLSEADIDASYLFRIVEDVALSGVWLSGKSLKLAKRLRSEVLIRALDDNIDDDLPLAQVRLAIGLTSLIVQFAEVGNVDVVKFCETAFTDFVEGALARRGVRKAFQLANVLLDHWKVKDRYFASGSGISGILLSDLVLRLLGMLSTHTERLQPFARLVTERFQRLAGVGLEEHWWKLLHDAAILFLPLWLPKDMLAFLSDIALIEWRSIHDARLIVAVLWDRLCDSALVDQMNCQEVRQLRGLFVEFFLQNAPPLEQCMELAKSLLKGLKCWPSLLVGVKKLHNLPNYVCHASCVPVCAQEIITQCMRLLDEGGRATVIAQVNETNLHLFLPWLASSKVNLGDWQFDVAKHLRSLPNTQLSAHHISLLSRSVHSGMLSDEVLFGIASDCALLDISLLRSFPVAEFLTILKPHMLTASDNCKNIVTKQWLNVLIQLVKADCEEVASKLLESHVISFLIAYLECADTALLVTDLSLISTVITLILKHRYTSVEHVTLLTAMIRQSKGLEMGLNVTDMVFAHSQFTDTLVVSGEQLSRVQLALARLVEAFVSVHAKSLKQSHIPVLLSVYQASLSEVDQVWLKVLSLYDSTFSFTKFMPIAWGVFGLQQYSSLLQVGHALWHRPTGAEILDSIDASLLWQSTLHFPLAIFASASATFASNMVRTYDPRFMLPLFASLLTTDAVVDCAKFVSKNCLSYAFTALSCRDAAVRSVAYLVVSRFYFHVKAVSSKQYPERPQIYYVLNLLKNSIVKPNGRVPFIVSLFLAKVVQLQQDVDSHMSRTLQTFLYMKPTLELDQVPDLFRLFGSSSNDFRLERRWILELLADGLRESKDYRVMQKRYTFKLLFSFFGTSLADRQSRDLVLRVVLAACSIPTCAADLCRVHGLLAWISANVLGESVDYEQLVLQLLHLLWSELPNLPLFYVASYVALVTVVLRRLVLLRVSTEIELQVQQCFALYVRSLVCYRRTVQRMGFDAHILIAYLSLVLKQQNKNECVVQDILTACTLVDYTALRGDIALDICVKVLQLLTLYLRASVEVDAKVEDQFVRFCVWFEGVLKVIPLDVRAKELLFVWIVQMMTNLPLSEFVNLPTIIELLN